MKESLSTQGIKLNRFRGIIVPSTDGKLNCSKGANNRQLHIKAFRYLSNSPAGYMRN
jgi:hypothetical protein